MKIEKASQVTEGGGSERLGQCPKFSRFLIWERSLIYQWNNQNYSGSKLESFGCLINTMTFKKYNNRTTKSWTIKINYPQRARVWPWVNMTNFSVYIHRKVNTNMRLLLAVLHSNFQRIVSKLFKYKTVFLESYYIHPLSLRILFGIYLHNFPFET